MTVSIFRELGLLHTRVGRTVVSAAIFDDVIGLMLLAVVTGVIATGATPDLAGVLALLGRAALFFLIAVAVGLFLYPRVSREVSRMRIPAPHFSMLMVLALGFAVLAEALGMDFIMGPFVAGLFFDPDTVGTKTYDETKVSGQPAPCSGGGCGLRSCTT